MRLPGTQTRAEGRQLLWARGGHKVGSKEAFLCKASPPPFHRSFGRGSRLWLSSLQKAESRTTEGTWPALPQHPEGRRGWGGGQCHRNSPKNLGRLFQEPRILNLVSFQVRPTRESDSRSQEPGSPAASSVTLSLTSETTVGTRSSEAGFCCFVMCKGSLSSPHPIITSPPS